MTDRRAFLATLSATFVGALRPGRQPADSRTVSVEAEPTVFYAHPDGHLNLVRFYVRGLEAPAGRLRVYDRAGALLSTAGVLRSPSGLYGELWLPLGGATRVRSELEAPGLRGVLRTMHQLQPPTRWTLHWLIILDTGALHHHLERLPTVSRLLQAHLLGAGRAAGNPLPDTADLVLRDHLEFLRMGADAHEAARRFCLSPSPVALLDAPGVLPHTTILALAGAGVRFGLRPATDDPWVEWWEGPADARLLTFPRTPGGDPTALGFGDGRERMTRLIERWLTGLAPAPRAAGAATAILTTSRVAPDLAAMLGGVLDWNRRFAFPHIVLGVPERLADAAVQTAGDRSGRRLPPVIRLPVPDGRALRELADARERTRRAQATESVRPLAELLSSDAAPAEANPFGAIARDVQTDFTGTVVFNPTPFLRTDRVSLADGRERVVTNVPPHGYAFVIHEAGPTAERGPTESAPSHPIVLETARMRLEIDPATGAISSLVTPEDAREWVRSGSDGLNALPGTILERFSAEAIPGVGTRVVLHRWSPARGNLRSTVSVYDALPWVDIANDAEGLGGRPMEYLFAFHAPTPMLSWGIPAGWEESRPPVERIVHLRWLCLASAAGSILFSGIEAPYLSVLFDGTVMSHGPTGRARYRIAVAPGTTPLPFRERFGWSTDSLITAPAEANPRGRLPSFGRLFVMDQPDAPIVAVKRADDGDGIIVYVQDAAGRTRFTSLGSGLLHFGDGRRVDFLERDLPEQTIPVPGGVAFRLPARGVVALRLSDVVLAGG